MLSILKMIAKIERYPFEKRYLRNIESVTGSIFFRNKAFICAPFQNEKFTKQWFLRYFCLLRLSRTDRAPKSCHFLGAKGNAYGGGGKKLLIIIESIKILLNIGHELIYDVKQFVCLFNGAWLSFPEECRLGGTQWMADICIWNYSASSVRYPHCI